MMMKFFLALCLLLSGGVHCLAQKPNILWVTIEDTSPDFIGCYGNKNAKTPAIDRLAKEGVRFTNAFSTGTVCSPSRNTIITGVRTYALGTGNHRSQYPIPDFMKGFPYFMQQEGYYVTNNSKTDYNVADEKAFIAAAWNECSNEAGWWGRAAGQPFFAVFNFADSHQSRTMTNPYEWYEEHVLNQLAVEERIGEDDFDMPPFYRDSRQMRKQFARVYNSLKLTDNKIAELLNRLKEDHLMDSTIIFFYGDHGEGMPRGKTNGIDFGYRVPFVVWFPEMYKHLSPWGTGVITEELVSFEDLAPTLVSLAGGEIPKHMKGRVLLGPGRMAPRDRLFLSSDRSDNGIDLVRSVTTGRYFYSRNFMPFMPEARYIRYMEIGEIKQIMRKDLAANQLNDLQESLFEPRPAEFLFDLEDDHWETHNLASDPLHDSLLRKMRTALRDNIISSRDIMLLPEYEIASIASTTTPYVYRMDKKKYPVEQIYAAASLSGIRSAQAANEQGKLLKSGNKIVRYWAIIGLRSQQKAELKPLREEIKQAMKDSYPPVAVAASAISYDAFGDQTAKAQLEKFMRDKNPHLALMAINFLLYVHDAQPFVSIAQEVAKATEVPYAVSAAAKDLLGKLGYIPNDFEHK